ncbi:hypothetical protein EYR40_007729 [Pleurotus pulmonarius]|nr:hypothetical protein EYR38_007963 [Pleurotus pulmonarius]KAF4597277.1 hypothetical protein EYR40_007729 [Pleurotus pulmonarius]
MNVESNPLDQSDSGSSDFEEPKNVVHDWEELSKPYYAIPGLSPAEGGPHAAGTIGDSDSIEDKPLLDSHQNPTALDYAKPMSPLSWLYSYLPTIDIDKNSWSEFMSSMARNWFAYLSEIVDRVAQMMKGPITYLVFWWMLIVVTKKATPILLQALPPVCSLPGTSIFQTCRSEPLGTESTLSKGLRSMDFPKIFDIQKKTFDHLADQSASLGGSGLSLDLKRVEMASKDLVTLIKVSDMKSRDDIARTMNTFVRNAQVTGRGLSKFNAKIGGAMDRHASLLTTSFTYTNVFSFY